MHWKVKGFAQKVLSATPGGMWANDQLQRLLGSRRNFEQHVDVKVKDWDVLMFHSRNHQNGVEGLDLMEVGTGWFPVVPLCYHLAGARSVATFDLNPHLTVDSTVRTVEAIGPHLGYIAHSARVDEGLVRGRYERLRKAPAEGILQAAGVRYFGPGDATRSGLPDGSVDTVLSNSVLEHVPTPVIAAMMVESRRVLRPGGFAIHSANCADHYAYFDKSISMINYLRFTEREWEFWNTDLQYQNRLRPSDFFRLAESAGLEMVTRVAKPVAEYLATLDEFPLAEQFRGYDPADLCCTSFDLVARKN